MDFDRLLKLRLVVARFGELDPWRWWNTKDLLGSVGVAVLRRGFPRTYRFAQARAAFAVASHRSAEVFDPPGCATLWRLPVTVEDAFDARWEHWIERGEVWKPFFEQLERLPSKELLEALRAVDLLTDADVQAAVKLKRSAEGRAVPLPGMFHDDDAIVTLLAAGFHRGVANAPAVPYIRSDAS